MRRDSRRDSNFVDGGLHIVYGFIHLAMRDDREGVKVELREDAMIFRSMRGKVKMGLEDGNWTG